MVGRIREIVFEDGVDVDGIATLAASEDYVDSAVAGVQGDTDGKIEGLGTVVDDKLVKTKGTNGKELEQTGIGVDGSNNVSGIGNLSASGFVGKAATSQVNVPVGTTGQRAVGVTGDFRFNSETVAFEGFNGTLWKGVGGGGLVATPIDKDFASDLESGKHYLFNGAGMTADKTINMPTIAAESYIRVTVYNIPTGYKLGLTAAGVSNFIKDDTVYGTVYFVAVEVEQSSSFVSTNTNWLVDDGSNALGTVWGGALTVTGPFTPSGGIVGKTDGVAVTAANVGYAYTTTLAGAGTTSSTSYAALTTNNLVTPTLAAGLYLLVCQFNFYNDSGSLSAGKYCEYYAELHDGTNQLVESPAFSVNSYDGGDIVTYKYGSAYMFAIYNTSSGSTAVTARFKVNNGGGASGSIVVRAQSRIQAIRIA